MPWRRIKLNTLFRYLFLTSLCTLSLNLVFATGNLNSIANENRMYLAEKICQIDCDIQELDRLITIKKANGEQESSFKHLKEIQDDYFELYDSLKSQFQLAIHSTPQDFTNESRSNAWYSTGEGSVLTFTPLAIFYE